MANFCQNCGNELKETDKFCTKCGTPVVRTDNTNPLDKENIQDTAKNLKATMGNVSAAAKEKAKQAAQYSKNIVQDEEFRNEQTDILKKKAKQAQEYLQSEEFQAKKSDVVNNTKNVAHKFFKCEILTDVDYERAQKRRTNSIYGIVIVVALAIFLFPFFDGFHWLRGFSETVSNFLRLFSIISRVLTIPICIIFAARYYFANKAIKEYTTVNSSAVKNVPVKKLAVVIILALSFAGLPIHYFLENADNKGFENFSSGSNNASAYFDMTVDEYIRKYNQSTNNHLSNTADDSRMDENYALHCWSLKEGRYIQLKEYRETNKICQVRYICPSLNFDNNPTPYLKDMSNVFSIVDGSINEEKIRDILSKCTSGTYSYNHILYGVNGSKSTYAVIVQPES